jgi:feruloyl esterase
MGAFLTGATGFIGSATRIRKKIAALVSAVGLGLLQLGAATVANAQEPPSLNAAQCAALTGMTIPAARIGLPTSGARIGKAAMVAADAQGHPDYCLAVGEIAPIDRSAPNIEFNVGLPASWNGKAFMLGGGGVDGFIPDVTATPPTAEAAPAPLARGYAVFSSDSGHKSSGPPLALDASFALNREALLNWEGDALKKTHDAALAVIRQAYGRGPQAAYFAGGSGGGREALQAAARWPADWNGVIALYPARDGVALALQAIRTSQALARPGAYPPPAKRALLYQAALERCDDLDGVKDGVISNVRGCHAVFDPATASLNGVPLRCPGGADAGPNCLSDAELAALRTIDRPETLPFALASGDTSLPGFNVYTSDTGRPPTSQVQGAVTLFAFGMAQPATPPGPGMSFFFTIADQVVRYMITQDPAFDPLKFDIDHPGRYADRLRELSRLDARDLAMGGFARKGGKLLILQGTDDFEVSPRATEAYYAQLRRSLGETAVAGTVRFYEVPGFAHTVSTIFRPTWDPVSAIEGWAEHGIDPADHLVATDATGAPGRTRPLCRYPTWPRYKSGDVNAASSFVCAQ